MNQINKFIKHWKKYGWKKTIEKWKYNYVMLDTPEQLAQKEIYGYIGAMGGLLLAIVVLVSRGTWYIVIALGATMWIMYMQFKQKLQSLQNIKDMNKQLEELEKNRKGGKDV
jgi:hypothetical protein